MKKVEENNTIFTVLFTLAQFIWHEVQIAIQSLLVYILFRVTIRRVQLKLQNYPLSHVSRISFFRLLRNYSHFFFPPKCLFFNWLVNAQIERGHFPKVSPIRWLILIVSYCNPPHSCILFYLKKVKEVNIRVSLYYMVLHIPCKHIRYIHTKETILDYALYVSPNIIQLTSMYSITSCFLRYQVKWGECN